MATIVREPITGPAAWRGEDLARSTDWIRPFSSEEIGELDAALRGVAARGLAWREITRPDFPPPRLSRALADVGHAYEDDPAANGDRLLLRLWLATPNSRPLPDGFEVLWGTAAGGVPRGGIGQPATATA